MTDEFEDADLTHPWVERYRIPLVEHQWPQWKYEVALVRPTERDHDFETLVAQWPTEEEAALIGRYIDFRRRWYREHFQQQMLARALDVDSGTNTQILLKSEKGWHYRRGTWDQGLFPIPGYHSVSFSSDRDGLVALLDHVNSLSSRWTEEREVVLG
jgi:hypothetical protein